MGIKIDGPLPPERPKHRQIVRVRNTEPVTYICLSESIYSVFTHWVSGRSDRCYGEIESCEHCANSIPLRWRGYVNVLCPPNHEDFFLEFSETVAQALTLAFVDRESLRGAIFKIWKSKGGLRGRFHVEALERRIEPSTLHPSSTPADVLKFLWNVKRS